MLTCWVSNKALPPFTPVSEPSLSQEGGQWGGVIYRLLWCLHPENRRRGGGEFRTAYWLLPDVKHPFFFFDCEKNKAGDMSTTETPQTSCSHIVPPLLKLCPLSFCLNIQFWVRGLFTCGFLHVCFCFILKEP